MNDLPDSSEPQAGPGEIVAKAGRYYRNARYIVVAGTVIVGLWFAYDGWVKWPQENARFDAVKAEQRAGQPKPHPNFDIQLQRIIAGVLVTLAFPMLGWFLYRSRGEYRLCDSTLHVPAHPPVPLETIVELDKSKWDRKGIAYVDYRLDDSKRIRRLTLDDFVYERDPTDAIVACIDAYLQPPETEAENQEIEDQSVRKDGAHDEA